MTVPNINQDSYLGIVDAGTAFRFLCRLTTDGTAKDVSASTLTAQVLSKDREKAITAAVTLSPTAPAAWAQGKVLVVLPSTETVKMTDLDAELLILETDAASEKWGHYFPLRVRKGLPS